MDAELLELQRQFETVQLAKSTIRLSERNVVELVQKLHDLNFIDFDLLHTTSGKQYITPDQLRLEIEAEIKKLGRVSVIDLSDVVGVDLFHVERQAQKIVADDPGLMLVNGEIISQGYWDSVAEEINEKLQECSQIALAEIAAQLQIGSELVLSVLQPRLGTIIKGKLEGGQLYTPAYVSRITSMVRGATRGITVPTNLPTVWNSLQKLLQEMDGANGVSVEATLFQSIFNGLLKEGEVLGSLRAGVQWTPAVFAHAQRESVDAFYSQNSYIGYEVLQKLSIPQPKQYLQSRYPEGIALDGVFLHPSLVEMLDAAVEDAIEHGIWVDALLVLPSFIGEEDAGKILLLCPSLQRAIKSTEAIVLGESRVFSNVYIKDLFHRVEKELDTLSFVNHAAKVGSHSNQNIEQKDTGDEERGKQVSSEKGSKKRKGSTKAGRLDNDLDSQESVPGKVKKNQRKGKDTSATDVSDVKSVSKKGSVKLDDKLPVLSESWITQRIVEITPDLKELGGSESSHGLLEQLALHLKPMLQDSWMKRRNTILSEHAERRRKLLDNIQKQLDEALSQLQFYEKALDLFDKDPTTYVLLHKHLLKMTAASISDRLLTSLDMDNKLKNGVEIEYNENLESVSYSSAERSSLAKGLPDSISVKAQRVVEALEGKRVDTFIDSLRDLAEESGLHLKKFDKKMERSMLHSYRKDLASQVAAEADPVLLLPKIVALLYAQVHNRALQAPGRAISAAISLLKDKLEDSKFKMLMDYHSSTVTLLALQAAAIDDETNCSSDRILNNKEMLESKMPELKALVLGPAIQVTED